MTLTILGLGGSPRSGSTTEIALRIALEGASQAGARTNLVDLATVRLPLFNATTEKDGERIVEALERSAERVALHDQNRLKEIL